MSWGGRQDTTVVEDEDEEEEEEEDDEEGKGGGFDDDADVDVDGDDDDDDELTDVTDDVAADTEFDSKAYVLDPPPPPALAPSFLPPHFADDSGSGP